MIILSIDIGIKNFAYCLMDSREKELNIIQWNVINLFGEQPVCQYIIEQKKSKKEKKSISKNSNTGSKSLSKPCHKKASYCKNNVHYCKVHAKKSGFIIPDKTNKLSYLKKSSIEELTKLHCTYQISVAGTTKKKLVETLDSHIKENSLDIISTVSSNDVSLIDIGIGIANSLDKHINLANIDKIIIENQISPIANRMKTIQGMVAQYFIMKKFYKIEFISAINKLKHFTTEKMDYNKRKESSIIVTKNILKNHMLLTKWNDVFNTHKKKDDLADSLLQGIWYLLKNNDITLKTDNYLAHN